MPELPEVEAWRRQLDPLVRKFPIEQAGPAHIATLKTFDPPISALDGEGFKGVERRAKRFLLPTDDDELVVMVHLMSAGRLKYVPPNGKGAKTPMFRVRFTDGGELQLTEAGSKKRAGVWLLRPDDLAAETERLAVAIRDELARGLELRLAGANDDKTYRVHNKLGAPCERDGTPIARVDFEEHTIYYCPTCQTGGRTLKDRRMSRLLK